MRYLISVVFICLCGLTYGQMNKIDFVEYDLANGLHVILHQDASTPIVAVSVMYHVGSKNEKPDKTGFAHFFEHLLFASSMFGIVSCAVGSRHPYSWLSLGCSMMADVMLTDHLLEISDYRNIFQYPDLINMFFEFSNANNPMIEPSMVGNMFLLWGVGRAEQEKTLISHDWRSWAKENIDFSWLGKLAG